MWKIIGGVFFAVWIGFIVSCGVIGEGGATLFGLSEDAWVFFVLIQMLLWLGLFLLFVRKAVFPRKEKSDDGEGFWSKE